MDVTMFDNHEKILKDSLQKWTIHKTHKGKDHDSPLRKRKTEINKILQSVNLRKQYKYVVPNI